jgi:hypothetical protein
MQSHSQTVPILQPRVFQHSLDWRFLLPARDARTVYVLFEPDAEFSQSLAHVGVPASNQLSLSDFQQGKARDAQSLVFPFGLPVGRVGARPEEQISFYAFARSLLPSGSHLLIGFNHPWHRQARLARDYRSALPNQVANQLRQAGYTSIKLFGAMPDLRIPEYIFDLHPQTVYFALQNRFRRKPAVLRALRLLAATAGPARLSNLLPCYFAVAAA